ncbi:MAG: bifunctional hydroxymethylpyrimidine kinase/phosphomethylpyrimidine kinase [Pseudomonadota bacterium]
MNGVVLIIAGSDPSGGAGLQADIKTVTALGGYAAACATALTVQNTTGVRAVHGVSPDIVRDQARAVIDDTPPAAIKIGMLGDAAVVDAVAEIVAAAPDAPVVLDPVLVATSGDALAAEGVVESIRTRLMPCAHVVTPNADEAAALIGRPVSTPRDLLDAGHALIAMGARAALVKGGHLAGDQVTDVLLQEGAAPVAYRGPRLAGAPFHGTGCTLASAVATGLAQGLTLQDAAARAVAFVRAAIAAAPPRGHGARSLNHAGLAPPFDQRAEGESADEL